MAPPTSTVVTISKIVLHGLHVCWWRHRNKALGSVQLDWPETADTWGAAGRGGARRHGGVSSVQHRWSKVTRIMPGDREGDTEGDRGGMPE